MIEYDAVVVGGGPIGGFISGKISKEKYNVGLFERHKEIGTPPNCAGLVSSRVFDFLDIPKEKIIQNEIKGASIHSPSNTILKIGGDKIHALVIDRTKFDQEIVNKSKKNGTNIFLNTSIISAQKIKDKIELKTSNNEDFRCKLLIGADGPYSMIRDRFILPKPSEILRGIGAEAIDVNLDPDFVEIFIGNSIAPGFFAWIIPTSKDGTRARIGLCITQKSIYSPKYFLDNFFRNKNTSEFLKKAKIKRYTGGVIPLGALKKTYADNVMIAGDAAAQVKPTSGGGIYPGILCANHCSNVAIESLKNNNFTSQNLKKYHKKWYADIGRELFLGMAFRNIYKNLSDKQMDKYIFRFKDPNITDIINKYGDIDFPSKLVKPLIKKIPTLLRLAPSIIKK